MNRTDGLTGVESKFDPDEIIVSKTDRRGRLTYVNRVFVRVSQYEEAEALGKPHNIVRHPQMPRAVFKLLWDTIESGREIFAYVLNRAKNGDHYWVFAHVTPTFDAHGTIIGYHSNRRYAPRPIVGKVQPLYAKLLEIERRHRSPKDGCDASLAAFRDYLAAQQMTYDEFVFSLCRQESKSLVRN